MDEKQALDITKALANETRLHILQWLKDPDGQFPPPTSCDHDDWRDGVCVQTIQEKAGISQSVCSGYLAAMQRAGLVTSQRMGKWTYYQRNERTIQAYIEFLKEQV